METGKRPFSRQPVAHSDRRRAIAQEIVDRHTEQECQAVWQVHIAGMGRRGAMAYLKMGRSLCEQMAELLEPGALERMMDVQDNECRR